MITLLGSTGTARRRIRPSRPIVPAGRSTRATGLRWLLAAVVALLVPAAGGLIGAAPASAVTNVTTRREVMNGMILV